MVEKRKKHNMVYEIDPASLSSPSKDARMKNSELFEVIDDGETREPTV